MIPKYPIFIPSKGRHDSRFTMKMFDEFGFYYTVVIEEQEYEKYAAVIDPSKLLILPFSNKGLTTTRNWIWNYAESLGVEKFWTFDDNIRGIYRINRNLNVPCSTGVPIPIIEKFIDRFENVGVAGMNYFMFIPRKDKIPPYTVNTRVYSNMLLNTKEKNPDGTPFRNNLEYNDDTDLNIRMLKKGSCTIQFNAFNVDKATTMTTKGGITESYKKMESRKAISQLLVDAHPDCAKVVWKFDRWHHHVEYGKWKKNRLIKKPGIVVPEGINNYGMKLIKIKEENK
tara:strand:+ start:2556 stop:3407 length:852 start_codon:yes stop_codon:yes gene_type:complete